MTTLNDQRMEAETLFKSYSGISDTFTETRPIQSILNAQNNKMTDLKRKYEFVGEDKKDDNKLGTVVNMKKKFIDAEKKILLESPTELLKTPTGPVNQLAPYNNCLPYGVNPVGSINTELYKVDEKNWMDFSENFQKIFATIGNIEVEKLQKNSSQNVRTLSAFLKSFCGSISEWPQINPLSGGIGSCKTLFELFNKHYIGYSSGINESEFYDDFIGKLHTSHIHSFYKKNSNSPAKPTGFVKRIMAYNFDTDIWFESDDQTEDDKNEYKYNGFKKETEDSYGRIFQCDGMPVSLIDYMSIDTLAHPNSLKLHNDINDREITEEEYDILKRSYGIYDGGAGNFKVKNTRMGSYRNISVNNVFLSPKNIVIVKGVKVGENKFKINKRYCMLYHSELKEGSTTDLNEQTEIDDPKKYLFNSRTFCVSPYIIQDDLKDHCKDDILYSQRHKGSFIILFIRLIFQKLYPYGNYGGAGNINIFARGSAGHAYISSAGVGDNIRTRPAGEAIRHNLPECKRRLLEILNDDQTIKNCINLFDPEGYQKLIKYINDASEDPTLTATDPNKSIFHVDNMNVMFQYYIDNDTFDTNNMTAMLVELMNDVGIGLNTLTRTALGQLLRMTELIPNFQVIPVLMYRFIMSRMIRYYKSPNLLSDDNNDSLYSIQNYNTSIMPAKLIAGYTDFANYRQTMKPSTISQAGGTKSKISKKILPAIGGKKPLLKKQKGGRLNNLFTDNGANTYPKLFANRKELPFNPEQFKKAVKKYRLEKFDSDHQKVKDLFDKFAHINSLPLFYDGYGDELVIESTDNNGGSNVGVGTATKTLKFTEIAQLFLYNSVITNSTRLLIHFFSNIKVCLEHFITTELIPISDKVKIKESQHEKVRINLKRLVDEVDKLIKFLKYNGINLQDRTPVFDDGQHAGTGFTFGPNQYYIKNLFLGSGTFVGLTQGDGNNHIRNYFCQNNSLFYFLNELLFIDGDGKYNYKMFSNALKFLTDANQNNTNATDKFQTLHDIHREVSGIIGAGPNQSAYIKEFGRYIKANTDACFGGVPVIFFDQKKISLLMRSYFFLLEIRIKVANQLKKNYSLKEELAFSQLDISKKNEIFDNIKKSIPHGLMKTIVVKLNSNDISEATKSFKIIFIYIYEYLSKLIQKVNKKQENVVKIKKNTNKKGISLLNYKGNGGENTNSLYGIRSNNNKQRNVIKKNIEFIKERYQVEAEFSYFIEKIVEIIRNEFRLIRTRDAQTISYYYVDTRIRNFKIFFDTYLLTLGESDIPEETKIKLKQYIGFSEQIQIPNKNNSDINRRKRIESFDRLLTHPLISPQYTDPLWWAKIEQNFMRISRQNSNDSGKIYRLFIITTRKGFSRLRDLYLVDAFALASSNDARSYDVLNTGTGYRTHAKIKSYPYSNNATKKVYDHSNTIIKLTGIGTGLKFNNISKKYSTANANGKKKLIDSAIQLDIRDLIDESYYYYDNITESYKKLVPIFLQANTFQTMYKILNTQKTQRFVNYNRKIKIKDNSYRIYKIEDKQIKDIKEYRKWLYQIMFEEQMRLGVKQPNNYDNIEKTTTDEFQGLFKYTTSDFSGKCARVLNIYDYALSKSLLPLPPPPVPAGTTQELAIENIERVLQKDTVNMGSRKIGKFISRDDLIKLMLLY